jgi:PAS domain S-box-containing protein
MNNLDEYKDILEGISGGFFALSNDYRFTYWNRAAEQGTGLKRDEVVGKNVFEVFPNAKNAELGERYILAMTTRTAQEFETSYRDERFEAWFDIRIYPTESGLSVLFHDITEKKRQQRQKEILVGITKVINAARYLDEMCLAVGERIAEFMEIPSRFVCIYRFDTRTSMLHLMAPALPDLNPDSVVEHQRVTAETRTITVETALKKETIITDELARHSVAAQYPNEIEELRLKSLISVPLIAQDELQGVLEVFSRKDASYAEDERTMLSIITNELATGLSRKQLMYEITVKNIELENEKKKTDDANETLKRFLATFSHELRAPLNSIVGFSEILTLDFDSLPQEKVLDFMKTINVSGKHLQSLINDILDLSKIEAGKMELHVEEFPVAYFIETIQRVLKSALDEKNLTLVSEVGDDVEQLVVDQTRFRQILVNLVSNAVKFSKQDGKITISVKRVDNEIEIAVRDEGMGIKPEDVGRLFHAFQQASNAEKLEEGTGLGLVITKKLVELHGGRIWVDSEWEKGTTFTFRIPMVLPGEVVESADQLVRMVQAQGVPTTADEKPLVLIIEDNRHAIQLLETYLQEAGYRTAVAGNGLEGLEKAKELRPHLITLDIFMPQKDGWQVLQELKRHPICKQIPIIIISISDEKKLAFSMGAVDYFVKPVNKRELLDALSRIPLRRSDEGQHRKVLVIDDDKNALDLIEVILEGEGYDVMKTHDGKDGLALAARENPDLIILDLIMPGLSGFNVAFQLKQQERTRHTPIIILTSMDVDDETRERMQGYISTVMSKSRFTKNDLLREISAAQRVR